MLKQISIKITKTTCRCVYKAFVGYYVIKTSTYAYNFLLFKILSDSGLELTAAIKGNVRHVMSFYVMKPTFFCST